MRERGFLGIFIKECRKNFAQTGALAPSSRALAHAMASYVSSGDAPRRILEVGPGTGVFTEEIVRRMGPFDHLDVYEINPVFADLIEDRFMNDPLFEIARGRLTLHRSDVLTLPRDTMYDLILSGLPLNNFEPEQVRAFMESFMSHLVPGGVLSYFEYVFVRAVKRLLSGAAERERLRLVGEITGDFIQRFQIRSDPVLLNLPPAVARHLVKPVARVQLAQRPSPALRPAAAIQ
jgi:phospholipid N-methyltransferase